MLNTVVEASRQAMRIVLAVTAIAMLSISLGLISPGALLLVCLSFLFFGGLLGRTLGGETASLVHAFGKICAMCILGVLLGLAGIPFLFIFIVCAVLLYAIHK